MAEETVPNIAAGSVPYAMAHQSSDLMYDVLSLIHAATDLNENGGCVSDVDSLTNTQSRITNLLIQAQKKVVAAIKSLDV